MRWIITDRSTGQQHRFWSPLKSADDVAAAKALIRGTSRLGMRGMCLAEL